MNIPRICYILQFQYLYLDQEVRPGATLGETGNLAPRSTNSCLDSRGSACYREEIGCQTGTEQTERGGQDMAADTLSKSKTAPADEAEQGCIAIAPEEMISRAQAASAFLKALAHEGRLMILCYLSSGEKSVTELENLLESRQAAVSQQLARLRLEGLVICRRDGKTMYYSLSDPKAESVVGLVYELFCKAP